MAFQDTLEKRAEKMFQSVFGWEQKALIRIGKRVKSIGSLSFADLQAINNYAQYRGMSKEDFFKKYAEDLAKIDADAVMDDLAKLTGQNVRETKQIYADTIEAQHEANKALYDYRNKPYIPLTENKELQALVDAYSRTTAESFVNFSETEAKAIGFMQNNTFVPLRKSFTDVLDKAIVSVATGTGTFGAEMRDVLRELGGSGVRVDYGNGVTRNLDSMVRQTLLWGAKQASREYSRLIGEELGCDGIEIDWHSFPRPSHEFMQGKQFVLGKSRTINGVFFEGADKALEALDDYGCLHFETYIICGVSEPAYTPEELKRLNHQNSQPITIDGVTKTGYEWKQTMRRLERAGRQAKLQREVLKASGDNIGAGEAERTLKAIRKKEKRIMDKYQKIADCTGIKAQPEKMSFVKGKDSALPNMGKTVDNSGESGIINGEHENSPRKSKRGDYAVDWSIVHSKEYEDRLSFLSRNEKVVSSIKTHSNWALNNRDGLDTEELYAISLEDGREISKITDQNYRFAVKRTEKFTRKVNRADEAGERILFIHNHPQGTAPSITDINTLLQNKNASGITIGHNGSIYYYTRPKQEIPQFDFDVEMRHFKEYSLDVQHEKALAALTNKYGFAFYKF